MLADAPVPAVAHVAQAPARWTLLRVGPSGRTLVVGAWKGDGCKRELRPVVVAEDAATVTLSVTYPIPEEPVYCPAVVGREIATLKLDTPLDGRALPSQSRVRFPYRVGAPLPRLTGTRARDALLSLRNQGYRIHLAGPIDGVVRRVQLSTRREFDDEVTVVAAPRR